MKNRIALLALIFMTGCASFGAESLQDRIAIERVDSETASVGLVSISGNQTSLDVRGTVTHRLGSRGTIDGHVQIEALDAEGRVLSAVDADYRRMSLKARSATFSGTLDVVPERVARVRITDYSRTKPD